MESSTQRVPCERTAGGQSLAEYALIVSLILLVALAVLTIFGTQINNILSVVAVQIHG